MPVRRACSVTLACACAVAGLAGCSSGPPIPARLPPVAQAYALDVTTAGRVRWQVPPATYESGLEQLSPVAVGAVAVFAQNDVTYGLRLADGHRVWTWTNSSGYVAGMWRWQGLVVVLTQSNLTMDQVLTGLDASTGQPRWTLVFYGDMDADRVGGLFSPTADGGLAVVLLDGAPEVVDLSSGRVRWTASPGPYPVAKPIMAVAGGAVLVAVNGRLTSYDDQTGQVRWADTLMSAQLAATMAEPGLQASTALEYLTLATAHGMQDQQVLGISAADGRVKWRFAPVRAQSLNAYAPGLVSVMSYSGSTWQDELDPATGRVRWQVVSSNDATVTPVGIVTGPDGTDQISLRDTLTGQTRWIASLAGLNRASLLVFPAGHLLIVPVASPDGSDLLAALRMSDGHRAWQVTIPEPLAAPPSAVPGGMLVSTAIVLHGL